MKRQTYHITEENIKFIKEQAEKRKLSQGWLVNFAIEYLKEANKRKLA